MNAHDYGPADPCEAISWPAVPIATQGISANKLLFSGRALLRGWSLQNGNAGAQVFQLLDGTDASGLVVAVLNLAAGANSMGPAADTGILLSAGLFLVVPGGPLQGAVFLTPVTGVRGAFGPHREHYR